MGRRFLPSPSSMSREASNICLCERWSLRFCRGNRLEQVTPNRISARRSLKPTIYALIPSTSFDVRHGGLVVIQQLSCCCITTAGPVEFAVNLALLLHKCVAQWFSILQFYRYHERIPGETAQQYAINQISTTNYASRLLGIMLTFPRNFVRPKRETPIPLSERNRLRHHPRHCVLSPIATIT